MSDEISYNESYDMEAVTVPVTICLAIMVGWVFESFKLMGKRFIAFCPTGIYVVGRYCSLNGSPGTFWTVPISVSYR